MISATYESEDRGTCKQQIYNAKIEVSSGYVSAELEVSDTEGSAEVETGSICGRVQQPKTKYRNRSK